ISKLNQEGILSKAKWLMVGQPNEPVAKGRAVFRAQCAMCHTENGYLGIRQLIAGADAETLDLILTTMREEGEEYASGTYTHKGHVATEKLDYPFMPPLVGTEEEKEALKTYLVTLTGTKVAEVSHGN
ncbi:MAG: c-type cytochrome, partial [Thermoanaerobaculum sp.]